MYYEARRIGTKDPRRHFQLTAIAWNRGHLLGLATNVLCRGHIKDVHAEVRLSKKTNLRGAMVEVIRYQKDSDKYTMAKPCPNCERTLRRAGVKKIRYTNWDGEWETLE